MMKNLTILLILLCFTLSGCGEEEYASSEAIKDFPIPMSADPVSGEAKNPNITAYQKYRYSNKDEPQGISEEYLAAIVSEGWNELKEEQMGATRFFTSGERKVAIEARPDSISLYEFIE
jgi:hypothetical protein